MKTRQGYPGIDRFRIIAALLVVAVHTSPLLSLGALPDFLFTRVLARLGVPFFFAATGFFLLAPFAEDRRASALPLLRFVRKTALVYGISILLYLPVNFYAGHWRGVNTAGQVLKMLLVDGTMYHLWYLPAAIFGVLLVWLLLRYTGAKIATALAVALYAIGLLGDSYFGFAAAVPGLNAAYQWIFTWCDYTRNGLFFAPIFLLVGVWAARRPSLPRTGAGIGFAVALLGMSAEGLALYTAGTQRHDSMYILLPACSFFLLAWLASFRGASCKALRQLSLLVYLLHPWVIVLLRGAAGWLGWEALFVGNSMVHYAAVCILTFAVAGLCVLLKAKLGLGKTRKNPPKRAWMEIDFQKLEHNRRLLQSLLPGGCRLMPAVKGNAYGLGAVPVAKQLQRLGVKDFCVATLAEGIELRRHGLRGQILVLGYTHPEDGHLVKKYRLAQTVVDFEHGRQLAEKNLRLPVHIKVDTGMHRLGERSEQVDALARLFTLPGLRVEGLFTQLSSCDSTRPEDKRYTEAQIARFYAMTDALKRRGLAVPATHLQCSYGIFNYPDLRADYARPGLAIYGIVDAGCCINPPPGLEPIFEVKARIALVKDIYKGERVGYGSAFVAERDMKIAVVTMGYADGLPRGLSCGAGHMLVQGKKAPIVGNICMDQAMIDVSGVNTVAAGDVAVVVGQSGEAAIDVHDFARWAGTIPNEIVSRFGGRVERCYV